MEALMAHEASLELEERKVAEAKKLQQDMEDAEQKLEQGALRADTQWSAHTIGDKVTDASRKVAAWRMWMRTTMTVTPGSPPHKLTASNRY